MTGSNRWQWEPWRELDRVFRHLEDAFEGFVPPEGAGETPRVNVWKNDGGVIVRAEVPGISKEDLDITVLKNTLTLRGKRPEAQGDAKEGTTFHRRERGKRGFVRSIALPYPIDSAGVIAKYENGVLEVTLPRAEAEKPRTVVVS